MMLVTSAYAESLHQPLRRGLLISQRGGNLGILHLAGLHFFLNPRSLIITFLHSIFFFFGSLLQTCFVLGYLTITEKIISSVHRL